MSQIVKKRCNGPNKHENEFKLEDLKREIPVTRKGSANSGSPINWPEELVLRCRFCAEGHVVIMRAELELLSVR
jgi:hypothetical protein